MPKSSKQLDAEISVALSRIGEVPTAIGEFYYAVYPDDAHLKLYGPYATWRDAGFAGYFHKSADERTRVLRTRNGTINFFANGVEQHSADAIRTLISYPREFKLQSVKIMRRAPRCTLLGRTRDLWERPPTSNHTYSTTCASGRVTMIGNGLKSIATGWDSGKCSPSQSRQVGRDRTSTKLPFCPSCQ